VRQIGFLFFLIGFLKPIHCQKLNADALLNKTIQYHDPDSLWNEFKASFFVTMESAEGSLRKSKINLDLKHSFFNLSVKVDENQWTSSIDRGVCKLSFNGSEVINPEIEKKFGLNCERALMYKNYYTYLYGLPMKLKDPGTIISPKVLEKTINGLSYWVLKVNYKPEVGSDTWYFYFDKNTYALRRYQFFHDESKNDGEYIILENELEIAGIRMPKNRSWYYNSDNTYLGEDILSK
tara:strand:+ start:2421 stop:3128 length:708 start_codon:yes stop_codon:yes gene_type:complete